MNLKAIKAVASSTEFVKALAENTDDIEWTNRTYM